MYAQFDASRREKKLLNSSCYKSLKACTVAGRGEECPLCDPESELRKGGSWTIGAKTMDGMEKKQRIPLVRANTLVLFLTAV